MKLSDISPLAGMVTGKGAMGKLIGQGFGGILPAAIARDAQKATEEEERNKAIAVLAQRQRMQDQPAQESSKQEQPMRKGGNVKKMNAGGSTSASSRADGMATKGKTKGTMIMCGGGMTRSKK